MLPPNELEWVLLQRKRMIQDRTKADKSGRLARAEMAKLQARREANGWNDTQFDQIVQQTRDYIEPLSDEQFFAASAAARAGVIRAMLGVDDYLDSLVDKDS